MVTSQNLPQGIITERDVVRLAARGSSLQDLVVDDVMSSPVHTLSADTSMKAVLGEAQRLGVRHFAVVHPNGELAGVLTFSDLVRQALHLAEIHAEELEEVVARRTKELHAVNLSLEQLSLQDQLTEIGNRRAMELDLERLHAAAMRYGPVFAVVLFDVDYFKRYNDTYGHLAGDDALRQVGRCLTTMCRRADGLYRYGGEEMLMLLPGTPLKGAMTVAQRSVKALEALGIPNAGTPSGVLTITAGVACFDPVDDAASWRSLVARADQALYRGKANGRNRALSQLAPERAASRA